MPIPTRAIYAKGLIWRYGEARARNDDGLRQRLEHEMEALSIAHGLRYLFSDSLGICVNGQPTVMVGGNAPDPFPLRYSEWKQNDIRWNVRGSVLVRLLLIRLGYMSTDPLVNGLIGVRKTFLNPGRVCHAGCGACHGPRLSRSMHCA